MSHWVFLNVLFAANTLRTLGPIKMTTCFRMRCVTCVLRQSLLPIFQSLLMPAPMFLKSREVTWSPCPQGTVTNSYMYLPKCHALNTGSYEHLAIFVCLSLYDFFIWLCSFSLETSPITDSDTAKRTVFQRSYSVVASEYDKQHSSSPARVKAVPRRRVHSGDAGNVVSLSTAQLQMPN